jgi:hypothetical protein
VFDWEGQVSVTVIKDLAKAVMEQEQQNAARRNKAMPEGEQGGNQPAAPEAGSTQGASTRDSSKSKE